MNICVDNITILTPEECDTIIQLANETGFGDARVEQPDTTTVDTEYRKCQTSFIKLKSRPPDSINLLSAVFLSPKEVTIVSITVGSIPDSNNCLASS